MVIFDGLDPLFTETLSFGDSLIGMEHPERSLDSLGRAKPFHIPELSQPSRLVPKTGFHLCKETLRVLKQSSLISLNDGYDMLPMVDTEIEKGSFEIEGVSNHCIDETPVTLEHTL
jgi:hypothetical protein